ncbi:MAG: hypothetical protein COA32_14555 [Fluviicola sp.]|nr:MAG: hypothetical protein COA32_14555 [Fluviicola sp.]
MNTLQFRLLTAFIIFSFIGCETSSTEESSDKQPQEDEQLVTDEEVEEQDTAQEEVKMTAIEFAQYVAKTLNEKSYEKWNDFVAKKVYLSPYAYVDTSKIVSLTKPEFNVLFETEKKVVWGTFDGSGEEIKLSIQEYFNRFVTDFNLTAESNELLKDTIPSRGNQLNNVKEVFPNATIIEIHKPASEESMGMDWRSLMLVIEKVKGTWKLKALVHNEWTA